MTNEVRLLIEAVIFVVFMLAIIAASVRSVIRERRQSPDAVDKLRKLVKDLSDDMSVRFDDYDQRLERNRIEMDRLHTDLTLWKTYSRKQAAHSQLLIDLLHEMGYTGEIPPPPDPPAQSSAPPPPHLAGLSLSSLLARVFNKEELDNLASDIGALPEDLLGETIGRRATSLVLWARRHGCLDKLVERARELRPHGGF